MSTDTEFSTQTESHNAKQFTQGYFDKLGDEQAKKYEEELNELNMIYQKEQKANISRNMVKNISFRKIIYGIYITLQTIFNEILFMQYDSLYSFFQIFVKNNRMFYLGFFFIFLAIFLLIIKIIDKAKQK